MDLVTILPTQFIPYTEQELYVDDNDQPEDDMKCNIFERNFQGKQSCET